MTDWREIQKTNFKSMEQLLQFLEIAPSLWDQFLLDPPFALNLPLRLAKKIKKNSLDDPLLLQFVPLKLETIEHKDFKKDPLAEFSFKKTDKLLAKYKGRVLFLTTSHCAMNCRFCFRREFPYEKKRRGLSQEMAEIEKDSTIEEVILSGGDPLSLDDRTLGQLLRELDAISHIQRIRFHTRFPIGIPERITPAFLALLESCAKQVLFVLHINHPQEVDTETFAALKKIQKLGIPLLSQSVLLKGVNDSEEVLLALFNSLSNQGIMPYYLHQLDRVTGAAHFELPVAQGLSLMQAVRNRTSGYAVPRFVQERPGAASKSALFF